MIRHYIECHLDKKAKRTMKNITLNTHITDTLHHARLDIALAKLFPDYSRNQFQQWIKQGFVLIDNQVIKKVRTPVQTGQTISIEATLAENLSWQAQSIPLSIIFEDDAILVINKPVGLVVHPGAGNPDQTLVNALLHHAPELSHLPRAGIVHRLDKNTSGLLVIAKTLQTYQALIKQMQARKIHREYRALVQGKLISGGTIEAPIGRHPAIRTKMAVVDQGKPAVTHYRILKHFSAHTLLQVQLETGRTHQIRVHFTHIHHPIVGDKIYDRHRTYPTLSPAAQKALGSFHHQALHAYRLTLTHPVTREQCDFTTDMPQDMQELIRCLEQGG